MVKVERFPMWAADARTDAAFPIVQLTLVNHLVHYVELLGGHMPRKLLMELIQGLNLVHFNTAHSVDQIVQFHATPPFGASGVPGALQ